MLIDSGMRNALKIGANGADGFGKFCDAETRNRKQHQRTGSTAKVDPVPPCTTSYGLGWKGQEAVRYGEPGLAEVAIRSGFANQSHFCLHFKRIPASRRDGFGREIVHDNIVNA
jgi:hypothetical protein